jgi:hypothetical protein
MSHPYREQPATAFWAKAVANNWDPSHAVPPMRPIIKRGDRVASLGSCFAANLIPYLRRHGIKYIEKEVRHTVFSSVPAENFSYGGFSAAYGNIYTARQFRQLLDRANSKFLPIESCWSAAGEFVDPFRPGLRYRARSERELEALTAYHLTMVREVFQEADVVIFTLGLTEAWGSKTDGAVFPVCPGTLAGEFDPARHQFHNFSAAEVVADLEAIYDTLALMHPGVRLVLSVSPVPLVATATPQHVVVATSYSKSVLRAACGEVCTRNSAIVYFPSYEIIVGPQADHDFFERDRRSVSQKGVEAVMQAFLACCEPGLIESPTGREQDEQLRSAAANHREALSRFLVEIECEEEAVSLPDS